MFLGEAQKKNLKLFQNLSLFSNKFSVLILSWQWQLGCEMVTLHSSYFFHMYNSMNESSVHFEQNIVIVKK